MVTAASAFSATNLDDIVILIALLSQADRGPSTGEVVAGQVLGLGLLVRQELELGILSAVAIEGCPARHQPVWMVRHAQRHRSRLLVAFEEVIRALADAPPGTSG